MTFGYDFVDSVHESSVLLWTATMIAHKTRRKQGGNCQKNATDLYANCIKIVWELSARLANALRMDFFPELRPQEDLSESTFDQLATHD